MRIKAIATAMAALIMLAAPAAACSRASVSGSGAMIKSDINQRLVDAAILSELNYHRCQAGLQRLKSSSGLRNVAATHAKWMARTRTVSHDSRVAGQRTLKSRLSTSGVRFRAGGENIGMVHRFQIDGARFRIHGACKFSRSSGQPIGVHSYASLARHMVNLWMASPGHRRNILDRKVSLVGSAAGFNGSAPNCGQFFVAQDFAG